jgi:uncharacterized metal-binding protein YceD (DUF177 family)
MSYKIPFKELEDGEHHFEFEIDDNFFATYSNSEIEKGNLLAKIELIKHSTGLEVFFDIKGTVLSQCDRCLDDLDCSIDYNGKIFFEYGSVTEEISDSLTSLSFSEDSLELDDYIYEFVNISLPIKKTHTNEEGGNSFCNEEMLERLEKITINNKKENDPRWDKLKDLIN